VGSEFIDLIIKINGTTSIDYFWRINGGTMNGPTTLTTTLPNAFEEASFSTSNNGTAVGYYWAVLGASYER